MALGGGSFVSQNKVLPGTYINFVSAANASASLSDRGIVTMPLELDWGKDDTVFEVTSSDFIKKSVLLFGYDYGHEKLKGLRDLFKNAKTLYAYKLTSGGAKASNTFATAKYCGVKGNDISISITANANDTSKFDVSVYLDTSKIDTQTVSTAAELKSNDFVDFKSNAALEVTAKTPLSGGTNGTVNGHTHQNYLNKIESYSYNAMGVHVSDDTTKALYVSFNKRMRDDMGVKFQTVLYNKAADYEGVVNVKNSVDLVYFVTGIIGGCAVNASNTNKLYDGEYAVNTDYTQAELEACIKSGEFVLHNVNGTPRVLSDINSLTSVTDTKGDMFKSNQTIRVIDQVANDIAVLFNTKYLGKIPNDAAGRISLWGDIVKHHKELNDIRAIENFSDENVVVTCGNTKNSVVVSDTISIVNAMEQLYMTVTIE